MSRAIPLALATAIIAFAILSSGCSNPLSAVISPAGDSHTASGHVFLDGNPVASAEVDAVSANGSLRLSGVTSDAGLYVLDLPEGVQFNVTARYQGLRHTVWPVSIGDINDQFDIKLTRSAKSFIAGTGGSVGGYVGYDNSRPLTGFNLTITEASGNGSVSTLIRSDKSYSFEVEPNVTYHLEGRFPDVRYSYRNGGYGSNITVGPNETVLVDYLVILP
jgi:hypothetical protein